MGLRTCPISHNWEEVEHVWAGEGLGSWGKLNVFKILQRWGSAQVYYFPMRTEAHTRHSAEIILPFIK